MTDQTEVRLPQLPESYSREYTTAHDGDGGWTIPTFTADQMREYARLAVMEERAKIRALVLDDAWALTFQTFGQYRTALAAAIRNGKEP